MKFFNKILVSVIFFLILSIVVKGQNEERKRKDSFTPAVSIDVGGELYAKKSLENDSPMLGVAAIMVDFNLEISKKLWGFAAFHFDSEPWHSLINRSYVEDNEEEHGSFSLHVEEFFISWQPISFLTLKAGRRYSSISEANSLHLADYDFITKPRVLTVFFGDNHGLAIDGISPEVTFRNGKHHFGLLTEIGKNSMEANELVITNIIDYKLIEDNSQLNIRGFAFFDYQQKENNPLLNLFSPDQYANFDLSPGIGLNAYGASLNYSREFGKGIRLNIATELFNRKVSTFHFKGGFAMANVSLGNNIKVTAMHQKVEIPTIDDIDNLFALTEHSTTIGLAFFPSTNQRLKLEYSVFKDSPFYNNTLMFKYSFNLGFFPSKDSECPRHCQNRRPRGWRNRIVE